MEEIDIWRTAKLLIDQHGVLAEFRAATRASELIAESDAKGCEVWKRIYRAVGELQRTDLLDGERAS